MQGELVTIPLDNMHYLYRTFKGLRPLRLHVAHFESGFKPLTQNVFNARILNARILKC